jgi:hypothetical protein
LSAGKSSMVKEKRKGMKAVAMDRRTEAVVIG